MVGESDNLKTLRGILQDNYGINAGSFVIASVFNNEFKKLYTTSSNLLDVTEEDEPRSFSRMNLMLSLKQKL